jgi:hypothetical protein
VARGAYQLDPFSAEDVERAGQIMKRYADLRMGLADASVVVLAQRHWALELLCNVQAPLPNPSGTGRQAVSAVPYDA